jgi:indolepyruvate ferredoxin oxidoreductase alpha subunit
MRSTDIGIVCAGALYNHVREALPEASTLKLGVTWPLPPKKLHDFAASVKKLYVVEETCTYFADHVKALGIDCLRTAQRVPLPRGGEVLPAHIKCCLRCRRAAPSSPCPGPSRTSSCVLHGLPA